MSIKIKVKVLDPACKPIIRKDSDWIDLKAAEEFQLEAPYANTLHKSKGEKQRSLVFRDKLIPLGVQMELPKGFEAIVAPRSSSYRQIGGILSNSIGVIDCDYRKEWFYNIVVFMDKRIEKGQRICQFRIQPSQKANIFQKLKWLFSKGVKLEYVDDIKMTNRGGFGSTGVK